MLENMFMNTLILILIPVGVFAVSLLLTLVRFHRSPDRLAAQYRLMVVAMWMIALAGVLMATTHLDSGLLCFIPVILCCEWERRRLSRQLDEKRKKNAA